MSADREAIYVALFERLKAKLGDSVVTIGRRHIMPPDLSPSQQPALFVCGVREGSDTQHLGTGGRLKLTAMLFLYCFQPATNEPAGEETQLAATQINALLKAIDEALNPEFPGNTNVETLGGLVYRCRTEGDIDIDPGIFGQQAAAIIPVSMLVP